MIIYSKGATDDQELWNNIPIEILKTYNFKLRIIKIYISCGANVWFFCSDTVNTYSRTLTPEMGWDSGQTNSLCGYGKLGSIGVYPQVGFVWGECSPRPLVRTLFRLKENWRGAHQWCQPQLEKPQQANYLLVKNKNAVWKYQQKRTFFYCVC